MALETATFINALVETWPDGASDTVSQGDDHIRVLKASIKRTFPQISGEVSVSAGELNVLDGAVDWLSFTRSASAVTDIVMARTASHLASFTIKADTIYLDGPAGRVEVKGISPRLRFYDTGETTNEKYWGFENGSGSFILRSYDDGLSAGAAAITIARTANVPGPITILSGANGSAIMSTAGAWTYTNGTVTIALGYSVTPTGQLGTTSAHALDLYTNGTTRVSIKADGSVVYQNFTVATLPAAVSGGRAFVTDATATTFASIVAGGGSNRVPVYSDGTNWRIG